MRNFEKIIKSDLSSTERNDKLIAKIKSQTSFDNLFELLFDGDLKIATRTADAIEEISSVNRKYLHPHKKEILDLLDNAVNNQMKWNLALIVSKMMLTEEELGTVWTKLTSWATDKNESRAVRANSVHGLFNLLSQCADLRDDLLLTVSQIEDENIPSIKARLRILKLSQTN